VAVVFDGSGGGGDDRLDQVHRQGSSHLHRGLSAVEYFTFGFGTMVGVGWVVLMDDWLARGGPAGALLGFVAGGLLLFPVARTYGRMVVRIQDAGAEIAYTEGVFPPPVGFAAAWTMVLAYAIVCPWEAVAVGNLLARLFPAMNEVPLYTVAGKAITAPRLLAGLLLTGVVAAVNTVGIRISGISRTSCPTAAAWSRRARAWDACEASRSGSTRSSPVRARAVRSSRSCSSCRSFPTS
jgi:amino acid transporter